jgi:hypothetical protein
VTLAAPVLRAFKDQLGHKVLLDHKAFKVSRATPAQQEQQGHKLKLVQQDPRAQPALQGLLDRKAFKANKA